MSTPEESQAAAEPGSGADDDAFDSLLRRVARAPGRASLAPVPVLPSGASLESGRLSIVGKLGEGGMGVVYEAFDAQRKSRLALKTLARMDAVGLYRLKNEFRALADVTHPNLVQLHELFSTEQGCFFTLELVDGERFDQFVRPQGSLDQARLRSALPQLLAAISAIHAAGKLHRDLKPSNVLVTRSGRVVVLDFGLAVDPEPGGVGQTVADDSVSGTPAYMAPEQAAGKAATAASDLYACGVMLFEALTGALPFEGRAGEIIAAKQTREAPRAAALTSEVPADLDALCVQLLAREPRARPDLAMVRAQLGVAVAEPGVRSSTPEAPKLLARDAELGALRDAFAASVQGDKPVIVLLAGESGIGKSALCEVFLSELRAQGAAVVLSGRCFERESVPFKAFDLVVDELSRHLRKLGDHAEALLPREAYALRRIFPSLGRIPAIAEAPERRVPDPHELRRRAFLALGELLGRIRDRTPLVLHIDDLQWSDADSTVLLLHLVRQPDAPRLLLIASHRSEQMEGHPHLSPLYETLPLDIRLDVRRMVLPPLPEEAARRLLHDQLGEVPERLAREAGGNPFLLGELARHAAQHAHDPAAGLSLQDVVVARAAALPEPERRLLQVLAVAARPIDLQLAVQAAGADAGPRTLFEVLRHAHLVRATGHGAEVECFHDKVREALLGTLTRDALRQHHAALAAALFTQPETDPEQLAVHLLGAGHQLAASVQLARAADKAMAELGFDRAAKLYTEALEHGRFEADETQRLRVARADALAEAGRGAPAAEAYLDAMRHVTGEAAHTLEQRAAEQYLFIGKLEEGRLLLTRTLARRGVRLPSSTWGAMAALLYARTRLRLRGLEFTERPPDPSVTAQLELLRTSGRALGGLDFVRGAILCARHLLLALDAGYAEGVVLGLGYEIWNRALGIGDASECLALAARAEALLARMDSPLGRRWLHFGRGFYLYSRSEPNLEAALADFDRILALLDEVHLPNDAYDRALATMNRLHTRSLLGRFSEVARELPAVLDGAWQRGDYAVLPLLAGANGTLALLAVGAVGEAERELARATSAWSSCRNAYTYQDWFLFQGAVWLAAAKGDAQAAWKTAQQHLARFADSPLRASPFMADWVRMTAASAALLLAAQSAGTERAALEHTAERLIARIGRQQMAVDTHISMAVVSGRTETAVAELRATLETPAGRHSADVARHVLGTLLGGDEGAALVAQADAALRARGVVDPAHFVSITMPGISRPRF